MRATQTTWTKKFRIMGLFIAAIFAGSGLAHGMSPQTQTQGDRSTAEVRKENQRRGEVRESAMGVGKFVSALNLSAEQKEQLGAIVERHKSKNAERAKELRQLSEQKRSGATIDSAKERSLRKQIRETSNQFDAEVFAILTPDQQATFRRKRLELLNSLRK
jgi:Spy/CpxP family protein refolding chaperone